MHAQWGIWDVTEGKWMYDPLRAPVNMSPALYASPAEAERWANRNWRDLNPDRMFVVRPFVAEGAASGDREEFARGYHQGARDDDAGRVKQLCVTEGGEQPPVVKEYGPAYYHGYKAAVEGDARSEESAWAAYVAKHGMQPNQGLGQDRYVRAGSFEPGMVVDGKTVASWSVTSTTPWYSYSERYRSVVIRFTDGTKLFATETSPTHPNPAHLSLDGKLSSRLGRQDASHVGFDGDVSFGIGSKDSQHAANASAEGLTEGEVERAATRIGSSADWFARWQELLVGTYDTGRIIGMVADAAGAPAKNVEFSDVVRVKQAIDRRKYGGGMLRNAKGDVIWQDTMLTWKSVGSRGIEMIPSKHGRERALEMLETRESGHGQDPLTDQADFLEVAMGNGWSYVPPEDIGALTDATIISQDGFIGDDGKWYPHPEVEAPVVYAHMAYETEDPIERWADGKSVFWEADVLEVAPEDRARIRKEHASVTGEAYEGNARKNVSAVIDAFVAGRRHSEKTCSTDGDRIYSYSLPIAARLKNGQVVVLDKARSPSVTTSSQINAVLSAIPSARTVNEIPGEHAANPNPQRWGPEWLFPAWDWIDSAGEWEEALADSREYARQAAENARQHDHPEVTEQDLLDAIEQERRWRSHRPNPKRGEFKPPKGLSPSEEFFFKQAGYSYPTGASSAEQKRARVDAAKRLAAAEAEAEDRGWKVEWDYDQEADTSWMDEEAREEFERGATELLVAVLRDENGEVLGSLGGVHLRARGGRDPYGRVVEAELALEALDAERSAGTAMALNRGQRRQARNPWYRHMDLAEIEQILGAQEIARVMSADHPEAHAKSRAAGWWDANEPDYHDAYTNLARMLKAGVLDDLVADARGAR